MIPQISYCTARSLCLSITAKGLCDSSVEIAHSNICMYVYIDGWLSKLWSLFGSLIWYGTYYLRYPKRDPDFDTSPCIYIYIYQSPRQLKTPPQLAISKLRTPAQDAGKLALVTPRAPDSLQPAIWEFPELGGCLILGSL